MKVKNKYVRKNTIWLILLILIILKQLLWVSFVPMWQFPDEQAHFAQVQNVAEKNPLNPAGENTTSVEIDLSEKLLGTKRNVEGNNQFTYHPEYKIPYSDSAYGLYESKIQTISYADRHIFASNEATVYPNLYYQYASTFYKTVYSLGLIDRLFFTRIANIVLFILLTITVIKFTQLAFSNQRLLQIVVTLLITFHPMLSFLGGGINSDNLFILIFSISLLHAFKLTLQKVEFIDLFIIPLLIYLGISTKEMGRLIPLIYIFPFLFWIKKQGRRGFILSIILLIGCIFAFNRPITKLINGEQFLPEIPPLKVLVEASHNYSFWQHLRWTGIHTYREVLPWYWGIFRWLSLTYPRPVHRVINYIILFAIIGITVRIFKALKYKRKKELILISFLIYTSFVYFMGITTYDYFFRLFKNFSFGIQGRYFFPTILSHMTLIGLGIETIFEFVRHKNILLKIFGLFVILLSLYAIFFVSISYFSTSSLTVFYNQVSQYKPILFKTPYLEFLTVAFILTVSIFTYKFIKYDHK